MAQRYKHTIKTWRRKRGTHAGRVNKNNMEENDNNNNNNNNSDDTGDL